MTGTSPTWQMPLTWTAPASGWTPLSGWQPNPSWGLARPGWTFWHTDEEPIEAAAVVPSPRSAPEITPITLAMPVPGQRIGCGGHTRQGIGSM